MKYMVHVPKIKCKGCAQKIKNSLSKIKGIKDYKVDITNKSVFVNTGTSTIDKISKALKDCGYNPENITP